MILIPTPADIFSVVTDLFAGFGDGLIDAAPELLGIGLIAFGVPFVFRWGKRLVS